MKKRLAMVAALIAIGVGGIETAAAQFVPVEPRVYGPGLTPHQVATIMRARGMMPLTHPVRRGPTYVVIAAGRRGEQIRVVVDAYGGGILAVRPAADVRVASPPGMIPPGNVGEPPYGEPVYGPPPRMEGGLMPPRDIPNARIAAAPPAIVPLPRVEAKPASPPLPRPRPSVVANGAPAPAEAQLAPPPAKAAEPAKPKPIESKPTESKPIEAKSIQAKSLELVPVAPLEE